MKEKELNEIIAEIEEYYECAGFEDIYERKIKNMSEKDIRAWYEETFKEPNRELEEWEERHERGEV